MTFQQRMVVANVVGQERATIANLAILQKLYEKIDPSADERAAVECRAEGAMVVWDQRKASALPAKQIDIEDQQAARLLDLLCRWQFTIHELSWLTPLCEQLKEITA